MVDIMDHGGESKGQTWDAPFESLTATVITDRRYRNKFRNSTVLSSYDGSEKVKQTKCRCGNYFTSHSCNSEPMEGNSALDTRPKPREDQLAFKDGKLGQLLTESKVNWTFEDGTVTAFNKNLSKFLDAALERFGASVKSGRQNNSESRNRCNEQLT